MFVFKFCVQILFCFNPDIIFFAIFCRNSSGIFGYCSFCLVFLKAASLKSVQQKKLFLKENWCPKVFMLICTVTATFDSTKICCNSKAVQERSYKLPNFAMQAIFFQ